MDDLNEISALYERNGFPAPLRAAWRERGVIRWTALQQAAWAAGLDRSAESWLIAAPTSAGKGLVAEVAAARHLLRGEKVLWLAPTRALAEMFYAQLTRAFAPLGLRVLCATSDRSENDAQLYRNQFDLLIAVYEKAASWLIRQPHALAEVGLVVADELTLLRDPERGPRLDMLLTLLQAGPYAPRRIGLTLDAPNLSDLDAWWSGRLLRCTHRPRPLHEGVLDLSSGLFRWRDRLSATPGHEPEEENEELLIEPTRFQDSITRVQDALDESCWPPMISATGALAASLALRGEPTLLFVSNRLLARQWAAALAEAFELPAPPVAVAERIRRLAELDPSRDHELLASALERGVGFHHADLSPAARALVEEAYAAGQIALLIATPTLAQWMNLAASNVIHWPERPESAPDGTWRSVPLERWRFMDQGGRAARLGFGETPGRSILVAWDGYQAQRLWRHFIAEAPEPVTSALAQADLAAPVLLCLAGDVVRTRENLLDLFSATLAGRTAWAATPKLENALDRALRLCLEAHLIKSVGPGFRLTGLGQICAAQGLTPEMMIRLVPWLGQTTEKPWQLNLSEYAGLLDEPLPAVWALALCAPPGLWPVGSRPGATPTVGLVRQWFESRQQPLPPPLAAILDQPGGLPAQDIAALEAGWRLVHWIGPDPTAQVETRTGWSAGMLARAGEALAWIAQAAAATGLMLGSSAAEAEAWQTLAARLQAGVTSDAVELARLQIPGLGRTPLQALCADGLATPQALAGAELSLIESRVGDPELAKRLQQAAAASLQARRPRSGAKPLFPLKNKPAIPSAAPASRPAAPTLPSPEPPPIVAAPPHLEIDLQSPGIIRADGRELKLTPLSFDLLATLAERPGKVLTRAALYQRLWPEGGPEDQQLDAHRRRLGRELREVFGGEAARLVQLVRGVGFRLNLPENRVRLSRG